VLKHKLEKHATTNKMRVIKKTIGQTTEHYNLISEYETKFELQNDVEKGLSSIF